jgi:hypothetical protein
MPRHSSLNQILPAPANKVDVAWVKTVLKDQQIDSELAALLDGVQAILRVGWRGSETSVACSDFPFLDLHLQWRHGEQMLPPRQAIQRPRRTPALLPIGSDSAQMSVGERPPATWDYFRQSVNFTDSMGPDVTANYIVSRRKPWVPVALAEQEPGGVA